MVNPPGGGGAAPADLDRHREVEAAAAVGGQRLARGGAGVESMRRTGRARRRVTDWSKADTLDRQV